MFSCVFECCYDISVFVNPLFEFYSKEYWKKATYATSVLIVSLKALIMTFMAPILCFSFKKTKSNRIYLI